MIESLQRLEVRPAHDLDLPAGGPRPVGPMTATQAVALLRAGLPPESERSFQALASRLGGCPFLLEMVNAQIRDRAGRGGATLAAAVRDVSRALDAVDLFQVDPDDPESRRAALWRLLIVALRRLVPAARDRWIDLGALPAGEELSLAAAADLWRLPQAEARRLCNRLAALSLIRFDRWAATLSLRPEVAAFLVRRRAARELAGDPAGDQGCRRADNPSSDTSQVLVEV